MLAKIAISAVLLYLRFLIYEATRRFLHPLDWILGTCLVVAVYLMPLTFRGLGGFRWDLKIIPIYSPD